MSVFTVRILYIISIIRVRIRFIKMLISRAGVWIHSYLHAAVRLAGVLSAGFACTDSCAEGCGIQALVLDPPADFQESQTRLSLLLPSTLWGIHATFLFFVILFHPSFCHRVAAQETSMGQCLCSDLIQTLKKLGRFFSLTVCTYLNNRLFLCMSLFLIDAEMIEGLHFKYHI